MIKVVFNVFILACLSLIIMSCSESPEDYNKRAYAVADTIIKYSDVNFLIASDCQSSWRSVIFDNKYISPLFHLESYCYDFNEGLQRYHNDIETLDSSFIAHKKLIDSLYATIKKAPEKSQATLTSVKELFNLYTQSYEMMKNPSGSLQSYTNDLNELVRKYSDLKSRIEIEKK